MKKRVLWIAALVMIFTGGMIAGQLLMDRTVILTSARIAYGIEDAFFFLSLVILAGLTFRTWWPYIWPLDM